MDEALVSVILAPAVMMAGLIALAALVLGVIVLRARRRRQRRRLERNRRDREAQRAQMEQGAAPVAAPRLHAYPMPVVDVSEERVFEQLDAIAARSVMGHRVLPQLSLSAFLYNGMKGLSRAEEMASTALMSSRQVDFLIVDGDWHPVVAVSLERDALTAGEDDGVEADACAAAGVLHLQVAPGGLTEAQLDEIKRQLGAAPSIAAQ
jgi:hypothetical protein